MTKFAINLLTGKSYLFTSDIGGGSTTGNTTGGTASYPEVMVFADLPVPSTATGKIYVVTTSTGYYMINRKEAGLYISNGVAWKRLGDIPSFFNDENFEIYDNIDNTKAIKFNVDNVTTSNKRVLTAQDKDGTIALLDDLEAKGFSEFQLISDPLNETLSGVRLTQQGANLEFTADIEAILSQLARIASASLSIVGNPLPLNLNLTELTLDFATTSPSTDTDIIDVNDTTNRLSFKKAGRYTFLTSVEIQNTSNNLAGIVTLRIRKVSDNSILTTRVVNIPKQTTRTDFRAVLYDLIAGDEPFDVYLTLQGNLAAELILTKVETTLTIGGVAITGGGLASIAEPTNAAIRAVTGYAADIDVLNYTTLDLYEFDGASLAADDDDLVLRPDDILVGNTGRWIWKSKLRAPLISYRTEPSTFTLSVVDAYVKIRYTGAADITVTVPNTLPDNSFILIRQAGAGVVTLVNDAGVVLNGALKTNGQHTSILIEKVSANLFDITGGVA